MARPCTICRHPNRAEIDSALTKGVPFRNVAKQWQVGDSSVYRHSQGCVGKALAKVGLDISKQREVGKGIAPGPEYGASLLVQGTLDRESIALDLAKQAGDLFRRASAYLDRFEQDGSTVLLKPRGRRGEEAQEERSVFVDPDAADAFARVVAAASSAVTAAVSALGGGAGRHAELRGKLTGELKPASVTIDLKAAIAVLFDPKTKRLAPEAQERLDQETRRYLTAAIDAIAIRVPIAERQAAREAAWAAAKAARESGGGT